MVKRVIPTAEVDDKIIDILTYDAGLTFREIGEKLGLNMSTGQKEDSLHET